MSLFACAPGAWIPFPNPKEEEDRVYEVMKERICGDEFHRELIATDYEKKESNLRRIIVNSFYDVEVALNSWHAWVQWRHDNKADFISDEEVAHELKEGIFAWRGKNKENMNCCIVTGRMLHPQDRGGNPTSFKKFVLRTVEEGLQRADAQHETQDKICVIYDRRGLEYEHIDPNLFQFCKKLMDEIQDFYRDRIGVIYVIHVNFFFWLMYYLFLRPLVGIYSPASKIIIVEKPQELLEYFHEEDLLLLSFRENTEDTAESEPETPSDQQTHNLADLRAVVTAPGGAGTMSRGSEGVQGEEDDGRIHDSTTGLENSGNTNSNSTNSTATGNSSTVINKDELVEVSLGTDKPLVLSNNIGLLVSEDKSHVVQKKKDRVLLI